MAKWLTKSDYIYGYLVGPAFLWIKKYQPDRLPPIDEPLQYRFEQGHKLTELARRKFDGGVLVEGDTLKSLDETKAKVAAGNEILYEAAYLADDRLYARADIIKKNGDVWDMYEVKSATSYHRHNDYLLDLAFQKIVFDRAGIKTGTLNLVLVNPHYVKKGEIDPSKLFYSADVTEAVSDLIPKVEKDINKALQVIDGPEPKLDIFGSRDLQSWMPVYEHLTQTKYPDDSIFKLAYINSWTAEKLARAGFEKISDIVHPEVFELSPAQISQWRVATAGKPELHEAKIMHYFSKLKFPLYFLDYETAGPAIPIWEGTKPYQTVPFQYSIQVMDEPGGEVRELKFLHQSDDNPQPALIAQLKQDISDSGSVIVWSDYEKYCHIAMAGNYPEHTEFFNALNKRLFDLMQVFRQHMYVDAGFFGSASIKKVLPVIVPELSYKNLAIGEGQTASNKWVQAITGDISKEEAAEVFNNLLIYCGQDTMAMVKIYEFLTSKITIPTQTSLF